MQRRLLEVPLEVVQPARIALRVLLVVVMLVAGTATAAVAVSQTAWFRNWLRGYIVAEAHQFLNGELTIGRLDGNLFYGIALNDVAIAVDGAPIVRLDHLALDYNVVHLITTGISAKEIRLVKPTVYLRHDETGWTIARLIKRQEQEADREGPRYPIAIEKLTIADGTVVIDDAAGTPGVDLPDRIEQISGDMSFHYEPVRYSLDIRGLSFRGSAPAIGLNGLAGGIAVKDDELFLDKIAVRTDESVLSFDGAIQNYLSTPVFNLRAASEKLSLPEIARLVPALQDVELQPTFDFSVAGPLDRMEIAGNVRTSAGAAHAQVVADIQQPTQSIAGTVAVEHLNLAPFLRSPHQTTDLTGTAKFDLSADRLASIDTLRGTASIQTTDAKAAGYVIDRLNADAEFVGRKVKISAQGAAYGVEATAAGRVTIPEEPNPLAFDLSGRARHVDLRRLPRSLNAPVVASSLNADYHVVGTQPLGDAAGARPSADVALKFAESDVPGMHIAAGSTALVRARGRALSYQADAEVADVDLEAFGKAFRIQALDDPRYASDLGGHVTAEGSGTTLADLRLQANATLGPSTIAAGQIPEATIAAVIDETGAKISASGRVADLDPAVLSGKPTAKGSIGGTFTSTATIADLAHGVKPENVAVTAQVTFDPSHVGELAFERGTLDADYRDQSAEIRTFEIAGPDLNITAKGTLALDDTGSSNLVVHADSPRLEELGKIVDRPIAGIAQVDGTVTGNRRELRAAGTLTGAGVKYAENGALSLKSEFTATVPDLAFDRTHAETTNAATFVTVAGQDINEVNARITYDNRRLDFDGQAKQPERTLNAAGALIVHPDHQEVHLERLVLETANQPWQMKEGATATINYGGESVEVDQLRLVSGDQEIAASGRFGRPDDRLDVTLSNVDLASVDAILLRPPQFTGRLNASAKVSGTKEAPAVTAEYQVTQGGFRQFSYETFGGTVAYSPAGIEVDARLQQSATQWITAKGHVPTSLFRKAADNADSAPTGHIEAVSAADSVDLTIDSSPLGLGLVQGFTTAITDVQGTVEAHVRVTGSAHDPHAQGAVTVADGALTVVPTGVAYSRIRGQIELQPDRVHIEHIVALDNHDSALSITGNLAVHGAAVSGGQLWITGDDFKIVDNELGNVRIQSALELTGELNSPEIRGDLGITTGRVNLDEILAALGTSVYSTTEATYNAQEASVPIFSNLRANVRFTVPDDLVVRATDLRAPNATVGLGALSVTLGGDLTVIKERGATTRVVGVVNTVRGTYDFQGRRFEILRDGTIRFENEERFDPVLDIRTRRLIQGVEARVNVRGRMREPQISMSSTPPLEEADILSLIVFNQPVNQLGVGDQISLTQRAQSLAAGAVAGQLAMAIGSALKLDTFEIEVAPETGGGPQFTIGQQLAQGLYFKLQQGVGDDASTNVVLEYELTGWLRLQTNFMQGGSETQSMFRRKQGSGADLIVLFAK